MEQIQQGILSTYRTIISHLRNFPGSKLEDVFRSSSDEELTEEKEYLEEIFANKTVKRNSIIQINEHGPEGWIGCIAQVDEIKSWGVQAWVKIPLQGDAYIRIKTEQFDYIGEAVMAHNEEEEQE